MAYNYKKDRTEYYRKYYLEHKDKMNECMKKYRDKNKVELSMKEKEYRQKPNAKKKLREWLDNKIERIKGYHRKAYRKNILKIKKSQKEYCKRNPQKIKEIRERYYKNNFEKIKKRRRIWMKKNRKENLKANLNHKVSGEILKSLKRNKNGWHWEDLVGYTSNDLIRHLNKTMPKGYNWQDYMGGKLHIDHIIPISVFNFTKSEHIDFRRCWALKNLRLLSARENMSKHNKLHKSFQPALKIITKVS